MNSVQLFEQRQKKFEDWEINESSRTVDIFGQLIWYIIVITYTKDWNKFY